MKCCFFNKVETWPGGGYGGCASELKRMFFITRDEIFNVFNSVGLAFK